MKNNLRRFTTLCCSVCTNYVYAAAAKANYRISFLLIVFVARQEKVKHTASGRDPQHYFFHQATIFSLFSTDL